ncbi:MAG: hypothetical protein IBX69_03410 [Anaerolineales bacterium]|nr:hypothetical protein [Anaerolineales bacterium]
MPTFPTPPNNTRLGFHYFPDLDHYCARDLHTYLPEMKSMGATWITLIAPPDRSIPEPFLGGLIDEGIEPILHFPLSLETFPTARDLAFLFNNYARWGVHYAVLFDRPNSRSVWPKSAWAQTHLVERFLDHFIPLANICMQCGLIPVFPPLEPGGDYWDTAFLRSAFESLLRRGQADLIGSMVIGAYAQAGELPLNWGSGGPERWPSVRPYFTPPGTEDQRGFHIFDWYIATAEAALGTSPPLLLFKAGSRTTSNHAAKIKSMDANTHALRNLAIAKSLIASSQPHRLTYLDKSTLDALAPIPPQVLGCNLWLLSASSKSHHLPQAWITPDGSERVFVRTLKKWNDKRNFAEMECEENDLIDGMSIAPDNLNQKSSSNNQDFFSIDTENYSHGKTLPIDFYKRATLSTN